jgi:hypothetical protein
LERLERDKHSNVNYGQKSFIILGPALQLNSTLLGFSLCELELKNVIKITFNRKKEGDGNGCQSSINRNWKKHYVIGEK